MPRTPGKKIVEASEKAIAGLRLDSGAWKVAGESGLYVRCRKASKTFFVQRRRGGELIRQSLTAEKLQDAKNEAKKEWGGIGPKPAQKASDSFQSTLDAYLDEKDMAESTKGLYRYVAEHYIGPKWTGRSLEDIGQDRPGIRLLRSLIAKKRGKTPANQSIRLISCVYRWARKANPELPECPTVATEQFRVPPRDWALSPEELKAWGAKVRKLKPIRAMWWLALLFTGARRASVAALRWEDVDLDKKTIRFELEVKGERKYTIPASDKLVEMLTAYRKSGDVEVSPWCFPSGHTGHHIVKPRNDKQDVESAHHLRHTFRTTLAQLGATPEQARILMGHTLAGVSEGYITTTLVIESLRPLANAVAEHYVRIVPGITGTK